MTSDTRSTSVEPAGRNGDADHGNSPLSIIETPQVIARVG